MKGKSIPHEGHIIRYASWTRLRKDENDNVLGILPDALRRRENESSLSTTWIEHFEGAPAQQYQAAVAAVRNSVEVTARGGMAKANVGTFHRLCGEKNQTVRIMHEPSKKNEGHAGIRRLPRDNDDLLSLLADEAFTEVQLNRDIPEQ